MRKWLLFISGLLIVGIMTFITPLMSDDFPNLVKASNGILLALKQWYCGENGRFASAFSILCVSALPHWLFSIINGIISGILFIEINFILRFKRSWLWLPVAFIVLVLNHESCFWVAGAVNYLWGAVATLGWCCLFLSEKICSLNTKKTWLWVPPLVLISIFCAGFQELFCAQIAVFLLIYWTHKWFIEWKFPINGRFVLSAGYTIGTALLIFSPTTFSRSASVGLFSRGLEREIFFRVVNVADIILCNPFLILSLAFAVIVFAKTRGKIGVLWGLEVLIAFFFCGIVFPLGGDGREVFVFTLVGMLCFLLAIGECKCKANGKSILFAGFGLSMAIIIATFHSIIIKADSIGYSIEQWRDETYPFMLLDSFPSSRVRHLFDRSFQADQYAGLGEGWINDQIAGHFGKNDCIGLPKRAYNSIIRGDFFSETNRLSIAGEWYADPNMDIVACKLKGLHNGMRLCANVTYDKSGVRSDNLYKLINRVTHTGWSESPGCAPDVEILNELPWGGYVVSENIAVFFHNRNIDRARIKAAQVEPKVNCDDHN